MSTLSLVRQGSSASKLKLDRAPGARDDWLTEVVGRSRFGQVVGRVFEVVARAPDGIGIEILGLRAPEFEAGLVLAIDVSHGACTHAGVTSRNVAKSPTSELRGCACSTFQDGVGLLRVAVSSSCLIESTTYGRLLSYSFSGRSEILTPHPRQN